MKEIDNLEVNKIFKGIEDKNLLITHRRNQENVKLTYDTTKIVPILQEDEFTYTVNVPFEKNKWFGNVKINIKHENINKSFISVKSNKLETSYYSLYQVYLHETQQIIQDNFEPLLSFILLDGLPICKEMYITIVSKKIIEYSEMKIDYFTQDNYELDKLDKLDEYYTAIQLQCNGFDPLYEHKIMYKVFFTHVIDSILLDLYDNKNESDFSILKLILNDKYVFPIELSYKLGSLYVYKLNTLNTSVIDKIEIYGSHIKAIYATAILPLVIQNDCIGNKYIKWLYEN